MSSAADTSHPADRVRFVAAIEHAGTCSDAVAAPLLNCMLPAPEAVALLLDLSAPATFATCAARVVWRHAFVAQANTGLA